MTFNTLYEIVKHSVEKFSERIAFSMIGGEDVSYKEVGERVEKVKEMLLNAGVGKGDKVAILSSSMPNWGVAYFAVTTSGMVAVPILPDFTGAELDLIIEHSEAKAILVSDKLYTKLSKSTVEKMNIVIRTKGLNIISQTVEEQAAATAKMIFSLRQHRLELITGETGENVFGAGLKAALDEIARIEKECLDMFYGTTTISEEVHTFNVVLTTDRKEYVVCRFSDDAGVIAADDLSGKPIVLKVEKISDRSYSEHLLPLGPKDRTSETYFIVPNVKCSLVGETTLMDTLLFASTLYSKSVTARPIQ